MSESPKVLIIDDDREIAQAVSIRLRAAGYDAQAALDGMDGLKAAQLNPPAAVLLDIRMPEMDGFSVLTNLKKSAATKDIPVIVLSASAVDEARALDMGADFFLAKPFAAKCLFQALDTAVHASDIKTL